jgi:hypothetical protein
MVVIMKGAVLFNRVKFVSVVLAISVTVEITANAFFVKHLSVEQTFELDVTNPITGEIT